MNVLFFCHEDFACNSMGHIAGFAAGLRTLGHACAAAIPGDDRRSQAALGPTPDVRPFVYSDTWLHVGEIFPDGRAADIIHAWTPRENVRLGVEACLKAMPAARLVVHLEDNEEHLAATIAGVSFEALRQLPDEELARRLPVNLSHPHEYRRFLVAASGVTGIVQQLMDFVPRGKPFLEIWPGVDFDRYHPGQPDAALRSTLGLQAKEKVICYPGNSHFANRNELQSLYDAVFLLNRRGRPCRLIRTGCDTVPFPNASSPDELASAILHLGFVDRDQLPALLRLADVLVQPGVDDAFNRYRLPSKLPDFFASGRPVILPKTNVGHRVHAGAEALLLTTGDAEDIAACCERIFTDPALAQTLSRGAAEFARRHFRAAATARRLEAFYRRLLAPRRPWWSRWLGGAGE